MQDNLQAMANGDGVSVHSGFPNSGLEHRAQGTQLALDLNRLLIRHTSSTYLFKIAGHSWTDQGVYDSDVAIIDRALQAGSTDLIIAWRGDALKLCRQHQLTPEDRPWGVVTAIIHQYR